MILKSLIRGGSIKTDADLWQSHLYFALGQVCVRCQALPQGDVRVRSHCEGLFQLRELSSAEDGPLPLPLTLHHPGGSVRLRGGQRALTYNSFNQFMKNLETK